MKKIFIYVSVLFILFISIVSAKPCYDSNIKIFFVSPVNKKFPIPNQGDSIETLLNLIRNAQSSIDFAIYGISGEDKILTALVDAQKRGVLVRGVVDMNNEMKNPYKNTYDLINNLKNVKSDYKELKDFVPAKKDYIQKVTYNIDGKVLEASFVNEGIKNYNDKIMHNKYFIIDNKIIWTGSMNISASCASYNANSSILINSPKLANIFKKDFEQMYINNIHHSEKIYEKCEKIIMVDEKTKVIPFLLPQDKSTYTTISGYINRAQNYIYVPMFFFTHSKYSQDLIDAYARGVDVKVIVDATSANTGYSKHEILRMAGIPVKVENWGGKMHEKSMIIDDKYLLIGSMNFTSASHFQNDENSLLIENSEIAIAARKNFETLWKSIPNKWLKDNPKPEGKDSINSCKDGIDNDHDGFIDFEDEDCKY